MDKMHEKAIENIDVLGEFACQQVSPSSRILAVALGGDPSFSIKPKYQQHAAGCCAVKSCQTTQSEIFSSFFLLVCGTALQ